MRRTRLRLAGPPAALALLVTACGGLEPPANADPAVVGGGTTIAVDGSSTVFPITDAVAERYVDVEPAVNVTIGVSGTGGGFERFCGTGDIQIANASRPITPAERETCAEQGIEFTEVRVGTDALTMVTHPETDWVDCLTAAEAVRIWGPDGADTWDEVNAAFPAEPLVVFAPGADSGTYDFFNETVLEPAGIEQPRQDYNASENDNVIAQGVRGTVGAWGYFGFAYYQESGENLKALAYDAGEGCVEPSVEAAQAGTYGLTRPLFIYVRNDALGNPAVTAFVDFYLATVNDLIDDIGYIPVPEDVLTEQVTAVEEAVDGQQ